MSTDIAQRNVVESVAKRVREFRDAGQLQFPPDYSPENALKAAWLTLQETLNKEKQPVLKACSHESIAAALLDMAVQGLNPAKKQCYFIAYGPQLTCQRSYFGDLALLERVRPNAKPWWAVVYEDDVLDYRIEKGQIVIVSHEQKFGNIDPNKIAGAYCVVEEDGQIVNSELMTMAQIRQSWGQSRQYKPDGGSTPHHTFPDQMALRTVIRRCLKPIINESTDEYLLLHHMNRADTIAAEAAIDGEVAERANTEMLDFDGDTGSTSGSTAESAGGSGSGTTDNTLELVSADGEIIGSYKQMGSWLNAFSERMQAAETNEQANALWRANTDVLDQVSNQDKFKDRVKELITTMSHKPRATAPADWSTEEAPY